MQEQLIELTQIVIGNKLSAKEIDLITNYTVFFINFSV